MAENKKVLIVDDEESVRLLLERILEAIPGVEITLAPGSDEAVKLAKEHRYDLILLDLLMPGFGGIQVLTQIRASSANQETRVIIVSVLEDADTRIVCQSLGVRDYVVKPINRAALLAAVRAQLDTAAA